MPPSNPNPTSHRRSPYLTPPPPLQPKSLDIKKKLSARSERVKSCDIHPTESWALAALYSGKVREAPSTTLEPKERDGRGS